jgi:hypothetical protein
MLNSVYFFLAIKTNFWAYLLVEERKAEAKFSTILRYSKLTKTFMYLMMSF